MKHLKLVFKVLFATLLFLMMIFYGTKQVGKYDIQVMDYGVVQDEDIAIKTEIPEKTQEEKQEIEKQKLELKKTINTIIQDSLTPTHNVGDDFQYNDELYNKLCKNYYDICGITYLNGDFTTQEKIAYQTMIIYLYEKLNSYLTTNQKLTDIVYSIRLNKSAEGRRGYAGYHTITINLKTITTKKEFFEVLTHETGHIIDLGILQGISDEMDEDFTEFDEVMFGVDDPSLDFYNFSWLGEKVRGNNSSFKDFVGGYAMTDIFEDFAESFNMYINHNAVFQKMAQNNSVLAKKYNNIKEIMGGKYIMSDKSNIDKLDEDPTRRPWDTTKIK